MSAEKLLYAAVFLAEALTAWLYFGYIYTQTKSRRYTIFSFALGYGLLFLASQFKSVLVNVVLSFTINAVILALNYICGRRSALLHSAFLTFVMGISELLVNLAIMTFTEDYFAYTYSFAVLTLLAVFSKLLYFFITVIAARLFKPHKGSSREPSQIVLLCFMPMVSVMILISFIYIVAESRFTWFTEIMISMSVVALLLVNIVVLFVYNRIQKLDEEYAALQLGRFREQADAEYYEMLQRQYDGQKILIHDIKTHFNVIGLMAEEGNAGKIREYISELEVQPELGHKARLCDEPILNMILLRYSDYCARNNVSFFCDVRSGSVSFMDAASITALFGNLLSNAVEAAERSEGRMVELSVMKNVQQRGVLIKVVNSSDTAPIKDANGNLLSTKNKRDGHGYGMRSIIRAVEKFNGTFDMRYEKAGKEVHCVVLIPCDKI